MLEEIDFGAFLQIWRTSDDSHFYFSL